MMRTTAFRKTVVFATSRVSAEAADVIKVLSHRTRYQQFIAT